MDSNNKKSNGVKLSFVIPAYNEEAYIGKCLESILDEMKGKDYDIEIIVVNNASGDRTREVAETFPGVIVIDEPRKGLVPARRAGFLRAAGELVANVDADTILTPGWIDKVFSRFSADPELAAFSGPHVFYDAPVSMQFFSRLFYRLAYLAYLSNRLLFGLGMLQGGNFVFRREAFEKAGGYSSDFSFYGEDTEVARRLSKVGKVVFSLELPIYASARRLKGEGVIKTVYRYIINYFWTILFKKPFNKTFTDVRPR